MHVYVVHVCVCVLWSGPLLAMRLGEGEVADMLIHIDHPVLRWPWKLRLALASM